MFKLSIGKCTLIAVAVGCLSASGANAQSLFGLDFDRRYLSISGAVVAPRDSTINADTRRSTRPNIVTYNIQSISGETESKRGIAILGAVGCEVSDNLNIEAEFGFRRYDTESIRLTAARSNNVNILRPNGMFAQRNPVSGTVKITSLMANGLFSFESVGGTGIVPMVGAGLGVARHSVDLQGYSGSDTTLAYQAIIGAKFPVSDDTSIRFGYRYFGTQKAEFSNWDGTHGTHHVEVGTMFKF